MNPAWQQLVSVASEHGARREEPLETFAATTQRPPEGQVGVVPGRVNLQWMHCPNDRCQRLIVEVMEVEEWIRKWSTVAHESLHAAHFKSAWGGGHPPSLVEGFRHECDTYRKSAQALGAPAHSRAKLFIAEAAGKTELDTQMASQQGVVKEFEAWYRARQAAIAKMNADQVEAEYLTFFAKFEALPPKILASGKTPKEMLRLTYGY